MEERREPMASRNMSMLYGLGGRIRQTREQQGLSLTDLSIAVGSDKSALSKIEKGERVPNLETIGKLADEMGVPMILWFQEPTSSDARVDADGHAYDTLGAHIRDILPKAKDSAENMFIREMAEKYDPGIFMIGKSRTPSFSSGTPSVRARYRRRKAVVCS